MRANSIESYLLMSRVDTEACYTSSIPFTINSLASTDCETSEQMVVAVEFVKGDSCCLYLEKAKVVVTVDADIVEVFVRP